MNIWKGGLWASLRRGSGGPAINLNREISFPEDIDGDGVLTGDEIGEVFTVRVTLSDIAAEGDTLDVTALGTAQQIPLTESEITAGYVEVVFATPGGAESITASAQLNHTSTEDAKSAGTLRAPATPLASFSEGEGVTLFTSNRSSAEDGKYVYRSTTPMDPESLPAPLATLPAGEEDYLDATAEADETYYYRLGSFKGGLLQVSGELEYTTDGADSPIGVALVDDTVQGGEFEWIDIEGNIIAQPATAFFDNHPAFALTEETIDGQVMIRVPKSYWRRAQISIPPYSGLKDCWWVSASPQPGYQLFNAFLLNGVEIDQFWIGKYEGSLSGGKLCSLPGVTPQASRSWNQFHIDAEARNVDGVTGFCMHHMDMRSVIQWLYLIEAGSFDSQEATARGNVDSGNTYATDHPDNLAAGYRGIVALWGNLTEWIDGIRMDSAQIEYRDYGGGAWSVLGSPPTTGTHYPNSWDMSSTFSDLFITNTFQGSESGALIPDYTYYRSSSTYIAHVGGYRSNGGIAGLWYLNVSFPATFTSTSIGSRLARVV